MTDKAPQNILLIQYGSIGDTLLTTPVVKAVKKHFPRSFVGYVVEPLSAPVIQHNPFVDHVFVKPWDIRLPITYWGKYLWQRQFLRELRSREFDLIVDLESNYRTRYLSLLVRAKARAGFRIKGRRGWLNLFYQTLVERDEVQPYRRDQYRGLVQRLGIPAPYENLEFYPDHQAEPKVMRFFRDKKLAGKRNIVGVNSGGPLGSEWKFWPSTKFAALCDLLQDAGCPVILTAGPGEADYVKKCQGRCRQKPLIFEASSLSEYAYFMDRLKLFVTIDSGAKHLAQARKTATLTFFGGSNDARQWHPPGVALHPYLYQQTIEEIPVRDAFKVCLDLLGKS